MGGSTATQHLGGIWSVLSVNLDLHSEDLRVLDVRCPLQQHDFGTLFLVTVYGDDPTCLQCHRAADVVDFEVHSVFRVLACFAGLCKLCGHWLGPLFFATRPALASFRLNKHVTFVRLCGFSRVSECQLSWMGLYGSPTPKASYLMGCGCGP